MSFWKLLRRLFTREESHADQSSSSGAGHGAQSAGPLRRESDETSVSTLTMEGRKYDMVASASDLAEAVARRSRAFLRVSYADFGSTWRAILGGLAKGIDLREKFNYETHLRFTCTGCQGSLAPTGLGMLIMSQSGGVQNPGRSGGACRRCGKTTAYLIFDPDTFSPPKIEIAHYFVFQSPSAAKAAFRRIADYLRAHPPSAHGTVELRTDTVGIQQGSPFPQWLIFHFRGVDESSVNAFIESIAALRANFGQDDWEILKSQERIAGNIRDSQLLESLPF